MIRTETSRPYFLLAFAVVLISIFAYLGTFHVLGMRPEGTHLWSQSERASVARNYYEESMNFFKPRVHEVKDHEGITGLEFPLINYLAAVLYKVFGFHEYLYRGLMMAIVCLGLFLGLSLYRSVLKNWLAAIILVVVWYLSPVMIFYTPNFISDMAGLAFSICGWYFFFRAMKGVHPKSLVPAFIFFSLSGLVKITGLLNPLCVLAVLITDFGLQQINKNYVPVVRYKKQLIIGIIASIAAVVAWYVYAEWLSNAEQASYFTLEKHPVHSLAEAKEIWEYIKGIWLYEYYPSLFYIFLLLITLFIIWRIRLADRLILLVTTYLILGACGFIFFMLYQFKNHDYYTLPLYVVTFFYILLFADILMKQGGLIRLPALVLCTALAVYMIGYARKIQDFRYAGWQNDAVMLRYHDMEPYLRSLGIQKNDITTSIYDYSPTITLYFMNQKGWAIDRAHDDVRINTALEHSRYVVINDSSALEKPVVQQHLGRLLGTHNRLMVFEVKNNKPQ